MAHKNGETIGISVSPEQIIEAVKKMGKLQRDAFLEDLIAAANPKYLEGIKEAREDYRKGRVYSHEQVFKHQ